MDKLEHLLRPLFFLLILHSLLIHGNLADEEAPGSGDGEVVFVEEGFLMEIQGETALVEDGSGEGSGQEIKEETEEESSEQEASIEESVEEEEEPDPISTRPIVRNINDYPVCVVDEDCGEISQRKGVNYRCFQYMCYPWDSRELGGSFTSCKRRADCGEGEDCFRHQNRRNVYSGICLDKSEMSTCFDHSDCPSDLRCTNFYCGEAHYYRALHSVMCRPSEHSFCQDLLLGDSCCYDFSEPGLLNPDQLPEMRC